MTTVSLMQSAPGPETIVDGVRYLYFGGTSYLGLAGHPEVIEAGCAALRQFGVHSATSRDRIGNIPPVRQVEQLAAAHFGCEDAFYFGSGYASNHILVSALAADAECVCVDASAHYCVLEAARLAGLPVRTFRNRDATDLARAIADAQRPLVMADAVEAASGALAPVFDYLDVLARCAGAILLLDDAHGFGVLGGAGRGLLDELGLWPHANGGVAVQGVRLCVGGTLAKALGGYGGIIPGTREFVARARGGSHYYEGASAPASASAGSTVKALEIVQREPELRERLRVNSARLRAGLRQLGLTVPEGRTAHFGVSIGDRQQMGRIHERLKARGIFLPYLSAYAGTPSGGLLRFAVFANHTAAQVDRLLAELKAILLPP